MGNDFNPSIEISHYFIKVYVNGLLHVMVKRNEFVGISSWSDGNSKYSIEYHTNQTSILTEFDSRENWERVLVVLNENIVSI